MFARPRLFPVEILENRIAPAGLLYFVQNNAVAVLKADGASAQDTTAETDAATAAHSDLAVLLKAGDTLVFDSDNDHTLSTGDTVLAKIAKGQAMVFFDNGIGATVAGLDQNEITGAVVSDGFAGTFSTDINGSVATALDAAGVLTANAGTLTVQDASIASLHVTGQIHGHVLAGRNISDVEIGGKQFNTGAQYSVSGAIATGSKASSLNDASFDNGANTLMTSYQPPSGANGGNISDVTIPFGAARLDASDGADIADGKAGAGGSVKNVTSTDATGALSIFAGAGGNATASGTGGPGGSISVVTITEHAMVADNLRFVAGAGGSSMKGNGGNGGGIADLTVEVLDGANSFVAQAGNGGGGGDKGSGGKGGPLSKITVATHDLAADFNILAGDGGTSGLAGGSGGQGGLAKTVQWTGQGTQIGGAVAIRAGDGELGFSKGGAGGLLSGLTVDLQAAAHGVTIGAGFGGEGSTAAIHSAGGPGGALAHLDITTQALQTLSVKAGEAGRSVFAAGKNGGAAQDIQVTTMGAVSSQLSISSGIAGDVLGTGNGGKGGPLSGLTLNNKGGIQAFSVVGGRGGNVESSGMSMILARGNGGVGGAVSKITINNFADLAVQSSVNSGGGGTVDGSPGTFGNGGAGGGVSGVIIHDFFAGGATSAFNVYAGSGKTGAGEGTRGGNSGVVKKITLDGESSKFVIGAFLPFGSGGGSGSGPKGVAGNGGAIMDVQGKVGVLDILGSAGGFSFDGKGGAGGSVMKINVTTSGAGHLIHSILGGAGGSGSDHHAGAGGSVIGVKTNGDIGDFTRTFGFGSVPGGQGGISAGQGGSAPNFPGVNGSVVDITAQRIASIVAGVPNPDAITARNAVTKLARITATVLGADTGVMGNHQDPGGSGGTFDWNEGSANNATFDLGSNDAAIDGLIIVKGSVAPKLPVAPLKLILAP